MEGSMGRALLKVMAPFLFFLVSIGGLGAGQNKAVKPEKQQIKERQKKARNLLSVQEHNTQKALKGARIPASQRAQVRHQMKREKRDLKKNQRDERQDFRDRQKVLKEKAGHP
jgi:altronate dehydratase